MNKDRSACGDPSVSGTRINSSAAPLPNSALIRAGDLDGTRQLLCWYVRLPHGSKLVQPAQETFNRKGKVLDIVGARETVDLTDETGRVDPAPEATSMNESEITESRSKVMTYTTRSSLQDRRSRSSRLAQRPRFDSTSQLFGGSEGSEPHLLNVVAAVQKGHCNGAFCKLGLAGGYATGLDEPTTTTEEMAGANADRSKEAQDERDASGQRGAYATRLFHPSEAR